MSLSYNWLDDGWILCQRLTVDTHYLINIFLGIVDKTSGNLVIRTSIFVKKEWSSGLAIWCGINDNHSNYPISIKPILIDPLFYPR